MVYASAIKHATKNDNERAKTDEREKRETEKERELKVPIVHLFWTQRRW